MEEEKKEEVKENKKSVGGIITKVICSIIFIIIVLNTIIGVLSIQKVNDNKEPIWYINSKDETVDGKKQTTYNLGLYVIVKTIDGKETKTILKPFFL